MRPSDPSSEIGVPEGASADSLSHGATRGEFPAGSLPPLVQQVGGGLRIELKPTVCPPTDYRSLSRCLEHPAFQTHSPDRGSRLCDSGSGGSRATTTVFKCPVGTRQRRSN